MSRQTLLTRLREERGLTRARLGYVAEVHPARVGAFELGRIVPRPGGVELQRLAAALSYGGDPADLLMAVNDDHE